MVNKETLSVMAKGIRNIPFNRRDGEWDDASANSPSIVFENVSFRFSEHDDWILKDIDISIASGEWISIVGGNGSGKSTFVKLANGLLKPTLGTKLDSFTFRFYWKISYESGKRRDYGDHPTADGI